MSKLRAYLQSAGKAVYGAIDRTDVMTSAGLVLMAVGLWDVYRPAAFVIAGAVLVWCGLPPRPPFVGGGKG